MRVVVTGSRKWENEGVVLARLAMLPKGSVIAHGDASGADRCADRAAKALIMERHIYPAHWNDGGRKAGPLRNQHMLEDFKPDLVIAYPLPDSKGTWERVKRAQKAKVPVEIYGEGSYTGPEFEAELQPRVMAR